MQNIKNFTAPTPTFADALAFAEHHSVLPGFRPFHWLNLTWDLRRRYATEGARYLMRVGVIGYDPIVTEERFARNWIAADRKEFKTSDECLVTRMQEWREKVAYWTRHHEERIRSQYPPPPPLIKH
jgi:hypothetical protein